MAIEYPGQYRHDYKWKNESNPNDLIDCVRVNRDVANPDIKPDAKPQTHWVDDSALKRQAGDYCDVFKVPSKSSQVQNTQTQVATASNPVQTTQYKCTCTIISGSGLTPTCTCDIMSSG
jgi:hypothetical protein